MAQKQTDPELFDAFVAGDVAAFKELWDRHAQPIRRFLRALFGAGVASEDFLQEAFLSLALNARGIRDPRMLRTYLMTAARRVAFIERRRTRQRALYALALPSEDAARSVDHDGRETLRKVEALLERLSPRRRAAFTLYCVEQRSLVEAADELGVSPATFRRELQAARRYVFRWMASETGHAPAPLHVRTARSSSPGGRSLEQTADRR